MTRKMGMRWHLREVMATRGMFSTTDLIAPLAERGVELSREQVYRLVTGQPERLNVYTLMIPAAELNRLPGAARVRVRQCGAIAPDGWRTSGSIDRWFTAVC